MFGRRGEIALMAHPRDLIRRGRFSHAWFVDDIQRNVARYWLILEVEMKFWHACSFYGAVWSPGLQTNSLLHRLKFEKTLTRWQPKITWQFTVAYVTL